jgi:hypothetical protein
MFIAVAPDFPEARGGNQRLCHRKTTDNLSREMNCPARLLKINQTMVIFEVILMERPS